MSTTHDRRPGPPRRRPGTAAANTPAPRRPARREGTNYQPATPPAPRQPRALTPMGQPWTPGRSWLMPPLVWGALVFAGLVLQYAHLDQRTATAGGVVLTALGVAGAWLGTNDHQRADRNVMIGVYHPATRIYLAGSALLYGAWLTGITSTGKSYTAPAWIVVAFAVFTGWAAFPAVRHAQIRHEQWVRDQLAGLLDDDEPEPEPAPEPVLDPEQRDRIKYERLLARAGVKSGPGGVEVLSKDTSECGPVLHVMLPADMSVTYDTLVQAAERLGGVIGHGMRDGLRPDAVRVQRARNRHGKLINTECYIYIDVRDILAETIWLVEDHTPTSIYRAFPIGKFADGTWIYLTLADIHMLITGATRKGKSNLLHVLIFQLSRCVDATLWMYDGKGGAVANLWNGPWLRGAIDPTTGEPLAAPILDWVAVDRFELERMLLAFIELANTRPLLRARRGQADPNYPVGDKWTATQDDPAVFFICDEIAEGVGAHTGPQYSSAYEGASSSDLGKLVTRAVCLGCGEQCHMILASQRGTVTMIGGGDGKSQLAGRVSFPMSSTGDGAETFQKDPRATQLLSTLEHPGSVVVDGFGYEEPMPGKVMLAGTPANIAERVGKWAIAHTPYRPELDAESADTVAPFGFLDKWSDPDRTWWCRGLKKPPPTLRRFTPPAPGMAETTATPAPAGDAPAADIPDGIVSPFAAAFDQVAAAGQPVPGPTPADVAGAAPLDVGEDLAWAQLANAYHAEQTRKAAEELRTGVPAADEVPTTGYDRFIEIIREGGRHGAKLPQVYERLRAEGLAPAEPRTLYAWRDKGVRAGKLARPHTTRNAPVYAAEHV